MPEALQEAYLDKKKWAECVKTPEFRGFLGVLEEENMKAHLLYEDCFNEVGRILNEIPVKNFVKGYRAEVIEKSFDELKFAYRSTTSHIFKRIHENKKINSHTRNKIKLRLFCCHMVNRIFNRKEVTENFPYFAKWLAVHKVVYPHAFDFYHFKQWIHE